MVVAPDDDDDDDDDDDFALCSSLQFCLDLSIRPFFFWWGLLPPLSPDPTYFKE